MLSAADDQEAICISSALLNLREHKLFPFLIPPSSLLCRISVVASFFRVVKRNASSVPLFTRHVNVPVGVWRTSKFHSEGRHIMFNLFTYKPTTRLSKVALENLGIPLFLLPFNAEKGLRCTQDLRCPPLLPVISTDYENHKLKADTRPFGPAHALMTARARGKRPSGCRTFKLGQFLISRTHFKLNH